jgi:hypothetical protein
MLVYYTQSSNARYEHQAMKENFGNFFFALYEVVITATMMFNLL